MVSRSGHGKKITNMPTAVARKRKGEKELTRPPVSKEDLPPQHPHGKRPRGRRRRREPPDLGPLVLPLVAPERLPDPHLSTLSSFFSFSFSFSLSAFLVDVHPQRREPVRRAVHVRQVRTARHVAEHERVGRGQGGVVVSRVPSEFC